MNELNEALSLLLAGMATVFTMLLLVVLSARLLIRLVNHFAEAPPLPPGIQEEELAVLAAAVEAVTQGQGQISSIEQR